jgi:hypothetical protein
MFDLIPILACEPVSLAIAAASAGAGYLGKKQQAEAQEDYQKRVSGSMVEQSAATISAINQNITEAEEIASRKDQQIQTAAMRAISSSTLSALESGVSGESIDAQMDEFKAHSAAVRHANTRDTEGSVYKYRQSMVNTNLATKAQLVSNARPIDQAQPLAAVLDIHREYAGTKPPKVGAKSQLKGAAPDPDFKFYQYS